MRDGEALGPDFVDAGLELQYGARVFVDGRLDGREIGTSGRTDLDDVLGLGWKTRESE